MSTCALLQAKVEGNLKVYFYDTKAGSTDVKATIIPARTFPQVLIRFTTPLVTLAPQHALFESKLCLCKPSLWPWEYSPTHSGHAPMILGKGKCRHEDKASIRDARDFCSLMRLIKGS